MIILIVAYDKNQTIGKGNELIWNIKEDLEHFKSETWGKTILFGENTFRGINKPLENRKIIVLSLDESFEYNHKDIKIENNPDKIIKKYKNNPNKDIYISGGSQIYELFLPEANEMIISYIKGEYNGDKYFPEWNKKDFKLYSEIEHEKFTVRKYKRLNN